MTEVLRGKTVAEAEALFAAYRATVMGGVIPETPPALEDEMDRLQPLAGVKAYPARVKCATLPWHALEAALKNGPIADRSQVNTVKTE
jgi:nitrogen fixation NifU-like protein